MSDADRTARSERTVAAIVYLTTVVGGAALVAPDRVGDLIGGRDDLGVRMVGLADVVIAFGLLFGPRRSRWVLARAAANPPSAAVLMRIGRRGGARRAQVAALALLCVTPADLKLAADLRRAESVAV